MNTTPNPGQSIPALWTQIVKAIASGSTAWSSADEIIAAIGAEEDPILDELAAMDVDGLIEVWERPDGLVITLSVLAAERFGYRLVETRSPVALKWARQEDPDPPAPRAMLVVRSSSMARFGFVIDPHPGPEIEVEQNELAARYQANGHFGTFRRGAGRGEPPRPTLLIGTNHIGWSNRTSAPSNPCPACQSRPLPAHGYCLCCDRWGLDAPDSRAPRSWGSLRNPNAEFNRSPGSRVDEVDRGAHRRSIHPRSTINPRIERPRRERLLDRSRRQNKKST